MNKQTIFLKIEQSINEFETQETEKWQHETEAELISLNTFERISYQDAQKQKISVKFWRFPQRLEINYGKNKLYFNPNEITPIIYHTPQGTVEMDLKTVALEINGNEWFVCYELILGNKPLGRYEFRLIYRT